MILLDIDEFHIFKYLICHTMKAVKRFV